jgi:hypothetical protein
MNGSLFFRCPKGLFRVGLVLVADVTMTMTVQWPMSVVAESSPWPPSPVFTVSPLDLEAIRRVIPLGNLNPRGGHVFPTDHIYLDYGGKSGLPVNAPVAGTVFAIRGQSREDYKIEIRVDEHLSYYLGHVLLEPEIRIGKQVKAGQVLGKVRTCLISGRTDIGVPSVCSRRWSARYPAARSYGHITSHPTPAKAAASSLARPLSR